MEEILSIDVWNEDHEESFLGKNIEIENFKVFSAQFGLNMHILMYSTFNTWELTHFKKKKKKTFLHL